jgi:hypothetical protein
MIQENPICDLNAFSPHEVFFDLKVQIKRLLYRLQDFAVTILLEVRSVILREVPQSKRDQNIRSFHSFFSEREDARHVTLLVHGPFMSVKAVQGEVDLPQGRLTKYLGLGFMEKGAVRGQVDLKPFLMADIKQLVDLGMKQRLALDMKIYMFGMSFDLIQCIREGVDFNEIGLTLRLRTKGASKVTNARDFDVKFLEFLQCSGAPIVKPLG